MLDARYGAVLCMEVEFDSGLLFIHHSSSYQTVFDETNADQNN